MNIGLVARADNTGLGNLSWEFANHLETVKNLVVTKTYKSFPERYKNATVVSEYPTQEQIEAFVDGLDVVVVIETPYNWDLFRIAKKKGVKTVFFPMYEWLPDNRQEYRYVDVFICQSRLEMEKAKGNKIQIDIPVDREKLPFRLRKKAKTFLFNAGHGGVYGRNGTDELLKAIPLVKNQNVRFIMRSQFEIKSDDPRVDVRCGNVKNYWDLWREGDVFILPAKFGGNFLPMNEAMSVGMPIMSTNFKPWNEWLPKELLINVTGQINQTCGGTRIDMAIVSPQNIADKIDEWAEKDIENLSKKMNDLAEKISWKNIKPKIMKTINEL